MLKFSLYSSLLTPAFFFAFVFCSTEEFSAGISFASSSSSSALQYEAAHQALNNNNHSEAFRLFKTSCEDGNYIPACAFLTICYAKGIGVQQDNNIADKWLHVLINSKNDEARLNAAFLLEYQFSRGNENLNHAINLYSSLQSS